MDLTVYIQLIFLCVVNTIFTFFGIILNTLVIASFWKSPQLRKKLFHFMIMVLSCFDLVAVITNHPGALLHLISWLTEDYDLLLKMGMYLFFSTVFHGFSFLVLLLMSIERYLGAYYPIFHRRSVTRHRTAHSHCNIVLFSHRLTCYFYKRLYNYRDSSHDDFYDRYISSIRVHQLKTV